MMKMNYCMYQARKIFIFLRCIVEVLGPPIPSICLTPPTVQNGYVSSSMLYSAMYSCNIGYQLSGSATAICEIGDMGVFYSWISVPTCIAVPCGNPPTIPNGSSTFTGTTFEETATYSCENGYQSSGSSTVTCQASGSWGTAPTCQPVPCGNPPTIPNGSRTFTGTTFEETATYSCENGYQLSGSSTVTCQANGSWGTAPTCQPVLCGNPPTIPNGSRTFTGTTFEDTATYSCENGYQSSGSSTVTCQASGSWGTAPTCQPVPCGNPPTIPNGSRTFTGTTFEETATYSCENGYQSSGSSTVTCQASGSWGTAPTCQPVPCGNPPTIPNGSRTFTGTTFGDTATYSCENGYQLSGSSTVTCQASGSWSTASTCSLRVPCGDPPTIPNGFKTFTGTTFGETATYTCNTGYQLLGSSTVTCQASGSWSTAPTCSPVPCGNPPTIPNGSRTFTGTTFEETATYSCENGYQLSGSSTVTCQASGSWDTAPTCSPVPCGSPPTILNGSRTFNDTIIGETATYICDDGYQLSGSAIVMCQASGSWSTRPSCNAPQPGSCDNPPTISNGSRTFVGTVWEESAFYSCNTGYQLSGPSTVTCQASGNWSTVPTCKAIYSQQPPLSAMDNTAVTVGSVIAASIIIFVMFVFLAVVIATKKHRNQIPIAQNSFKETSIRNLNSEETNMSNFSSIPLNKGPEATADPEYDEVGPPVVKNGSKQYSFDVGPCPAYGGGIL
ncbi:sushi, von Willebrand factor type A, EGF and pentraxin domain-containing protein 1-like isoform X5 [Halichondria panicea]|uniref:sushi, von Willebrand factor type A, EGF and pentraxin domain-containing protein 1-like isoform X5 n=1 Tax=Halichondria panicea TaxID=6063 RepID=UPI00312B608E